MRKTRKDNNHAAIINAFKQLFIPFCDLSAVGNGVPDGLIWYKGTWKFIEIKNREWGYGRSGLNQNQLDWLAKFPGASVYIIESIDDVISLASGKIKDIKVVSG